MIAPAFASQWPEDLHVMLVSSDNESVLMIQDDGEWRLPFFQYPESYSRDGGIQPWCEDVRGWFPNLPKGTFFTGVVEQLGEFYSSPLADPFKTVLNSLLMMEAHGIDRIEKVDLPGNASWTHVTNVKSVTENAKQYLLSNVIPDIVVRTMKQNCRPLPAIPDPRYRLGWFKKASKFLSETVSSDASEVCGPISQTQLSFTSTLLCANSNSGLYFLKSPALGCPEVSVTTEIAKLFPESTPEVLARNDSLNCFISRGFTHLSLENEDIRGVVLKLGQLQLDSISQVEKLISVGVPIRSLEGLKETVCDWARPDRESLEFNPRVEDMTKLASIITGMCQRLEGFKIPLSLAHGDAGLSNVTFDPPKSRNVMFFDWEFGHIGHPFCDLHRLRKHASEEVLKEYLQLWSAYVDVDEGWKALELACDLGWMLKVWSITDRINACNVQLRSSLEAWACTILNNVSLSWDTLSS